MTKIACASDTHGMWQKLNYPKADILIFAGDIIHNYDYDREKDAFRQVDEVAFLDAFAGQLKERNIYKEVILVAGNHDFAFQRTPDLAKSVIKNMIYLQDSGCEIDGIKYYGSPWQPWFHNWAFNFPNHRINYKHATLVAKSCWSLIPDDTNVLITHGPAYNMLDECFDKTNVGCKNLGARIRELKELKLHTFGHIHYSYGKIKLHGTHRVNAAVCGENMKPNNPIQVVTI